MTITARAPAAIDQGLRRLALVVLAGAIMPLLDTTIVVVAVNELGHRFHTSLATVQWVMTAYLLALSTSIPLTRWATDRFGTRRVWITALLLFITGSVLCGAAGSIGALIAFRVVQGLGGGMIMPVGQTVLARAAGPERMGRIMAVIAVPAMLAPVLGPLIGGLIVTTGSWRWMFLVNVPLCVLAVALAVLLMPRDERAAKPGTRLDVTGLLLLSPGIAALVFGLSEAGKDNARLILAGTVGAVLVAAFLVRSARHPDPLLDTTLLRRRSFRAATAGLLSYAGVMAGLSFVLPLYHQLVRGESPLVAGIMLAPLGVGAMLTMPVSGRLTDRRDPRGVAIVGILTMAASVACYTQLEPSTGLVVLAGTLFVGGLGHGLVIPALQAAAYQRIDRAEVASASTVTNIVVRLGMSVGTATLAVVLQLALTARFPATRGSLAAVGRLTDAPGLTHLFGSSLWWTFGFAALALVAALRLPAQPKRPEM